MVVVSKERVATTIYRELMGTYVFGIGPYYPT
jgi:hypothetical protein